MSRGLGCLPAPKYTVLAKKIEKIKKKSKKKKKIKKKKMLGTISGALARSLIYPITLNGYIYSPGKKKSKKSKKNRKNKKK